MQNILIVEDETNLGLTLSEYLETLGYKITWAKSVLEAKELFQPTTAIVLMDIGLPDGDGIELAKELREKRKDFILLFLSAQNDPETKYEGLEMGAEDYITKPFDLRELTIRLKKALNSKEILSQHHDEIKLGNLIIRFKNYELIDANMNSIHLGQKECGILELLYSRRGEVISRNNIIEQIWGEDSFPSNRTVDNYIVKLRRWIETDNQATICINSIRGVGYQLEIKE